ncbi:sperm microtubule associated protein 2-like [Liolophura sinensis]|uniref:sperm microtubule associated protein 2-like n=1 Tax=Liolophura sinensis TaxID=3198878 RepID=UPI0031591235
MSTAQEDKVGSDRTGQQGSAQGNNKTDPDAKLQNNSQSHSARPGRHQRSTPDPNHRLPRRSRSADKVSYSDDGFGRFQELSRPRPEKSIWWTRFGPRVTWGDQSTIEPISSAALKAEASERVRYLATPKRNHQGEDELNRPLYFYSCGRASQLLETSPTAQKAEASARVQALATPKSTHPQFTENRRQFEYSCGRSSVLWEVSKPAMKCGDRERTLYLARYKDVHSQYQRPREVQSVVSPATLSAKASPHTENLAQAKVRDSGQYRDPEWQVSESAKTANASSRSVELAKPKGFAEGYLFEREVQWPVSRSAKRAVATTRISQLAQPIVRASMDHVQFNPDAFLVKQNALKGTISRRVAELAQPVVR